MNKEKSRNFVLLDAFFHVEIAECEKSVGTINPPPLGLIQKHNDDIFYNNLIYMYNVQNVSYHIK